MAYTLEHMQHELDLARTMHELLKKEQDALLRSDIATLGDVMTGKTQLVASMKAHAEIRLAAVTASGHTPDAVGQEGYLAKLYTGNPNMGSALGAAWRELQSVMAASTELNRVNGMLISQLLVRNQQAINALRTPGSDANVYGPDGQSRRQSVSRGLAVG